jgi:hypothetical protein
VTLQHDVANLKRLLLLPAGHHITLRARGGDGGGGGGGGNFVRAYTPIAVHTDEKAPLSPPPPLQATAAATAAAETAVAAAALSVNSIVYVDLAVKLCR